MSYRTQAMSLAVVMSVAVACAAIERTAYFLKRATSNKIVLVKVPIPAEFSWMEEQSTVFGPLGTDHTSGLARSRSGRLYTLDHVEDQLLEVDFRTGETSFQADIDVDVVVLSDIAFDESDRLWLMNPGQGKDIYHLDPETGETSRVVGLGTQAFQIAAHGGKLCGGTGSRLVEIDTDTGALKTVEDMIWTEGG